MNPAFLLTYVTPGQPLRGGTVFLSEIKKKQKGGRCYKPAVSGENK